MVLLYRYFNKYRNFNRSRQSFIRKWGKSHILHLYSNLRISDSTMLMISKSKVSTVKHVIVACDRTGIHYLPGYFHQYEILYNNFFINIAFLIHYGTVRCFTSNIVKLTLPDVASVGFIVCTTRTPSVLGPPNQIKKCSTSHPKPPPQK